MNNILIYSELNENYIIRPVCFQLISKAYDLKQKLKDSKITVSVIGPLIDYGNIISELQEYGADEVIIVADDKLKQYNNSYYPEIFLRIAKKCEPQIILLGATQEGKEIASYTSTKLETGLTADCTDLNIDSEGKLVSTRPTFGSQLIADIMCRTFPQMATVQENVFKAQKRYSDINVIYETVDLSSFENKIEITETKYKVASSLDVSSADIIVSGGSGAASEEGFKLIKALANKIDAAVAGSREAFEMGYITKSQQIGQTGKTVAPKLYIAIGISGANQHLTGIKNSGKIIAINKDKNAPIFQHADAGIVGDLYNILPELINILS